MASSQTLPLLAMILVLLPMIAMGDGDLTAFYDKICQEVNCGKGTCVANISYKLNYICQCQPGWKRTQDDHNDDDDDLQFLPCVIPNCTLNYGTCQPAPPPVPDKPVPQNVSFFDPCYWSYCGEGTCTHNGTYGHMCTCKPGYYNLLNTSYYPCYNDCTIGSDCASLGIKVASSTSSTSSPNGSNASQASSILPGKFHWMIMLLMSMVMTLWK